MDEGETITVETAQATLNAAYRAREGIGGMARSDFLVQSAQAQALIAQAQALNVIAAKLEAIAAYQGVLAA